MTKRKENPNPHRFTPGHTTNVKTEVDRLVGIRVTIRPDQKQRLDEEENVSATVRRALDLYFSMESIESPSRDESDM